MTTTILIPALSCLLGACAMQQYEAKPIVPEKVAANFQQRSLESAELRDYMHAQGYPENLLPIKAWGLQELTLAAFFYHPQLDVARARWQASQAAEISANQKPNPGISTSAEHHSIANGVSPWTLGFSLAIPIETGGKREIRRERAASLSDAARIDIGQVAWQIRSHLRNQLDEYHHALQESAQLEREVALRDEIVQMLQKRLDAGLVSDIDLNNVRLQWQKTRQALAAIQGSLPGLRSALAEAAGLPSQALASVQLTTTIVPPSTLTDETLQRAALTNRLDIQAALARYAASEANLKLEIAKQYPDITLSPGYSFDQGDNRWSLGLSTILALINKNEGPIAEANAQRELEARQFNELQIRVISDLEQARARYQAAQDEIAKAEQLLVAQQQRGAQSERQFDSGFIDRLELAGTRLETLVAEQGVLAAKRQAQTVLGQLEDAIQRPLDDAPLPTAPENRNEP